MEIEKIVLNEERNVTLTAMLQPVGGEYGNIIKRPAILVLPGGGYFMCSDREADPVAFAYLQAGYQVFILRYSVGKDSVWPNPLNDYEDAMSLIRKNADTWHVYEDKVAVIGFSAGGHLAASAATMSKNRPNAAILGYPVIEKECVDHYQPTAPDAADAVTPDTCPCFVFATRNDTVVPVKNTVKFITALTKNDIVFESHIYSHGPHGITIANTSVKYPMNDVCNRAPHWVADSIEWLKDVLGDLGDKEMAKPRFDTRLHANRDPYLSVDCTVEHLGKKTESREILLQILANGRKNEAVNKDLEGISDEVLLEAAKNMTLRQLLKFAKLPETVIEAVNEKLCVMENSYI